MEELLKNKKLKKVVSEDRGPIEQPTLTKEEHQNLMLDANNEEWEAAIKDFTFTTYYMTLSKDDAKALLLSNIHRSIDTNQISPNEITSFLPGNDVSYLDFGYKQQLEDLTLRLQEKMKEIGINDGDGVFVKTSCRSPKDAPAVGNKLRQKYLERLKSVSATDDSPHDVKLDALLWAGVQCLKVATAEEAIELLCASDRIRVDMFVALNPDLEREWKQSLIIRRWVDIEPDMEFRGFINQQKFTALCQYNHQICSKRLVERKQEIQERLFSFWEKKVLPRLINHDKLQSYIIDFALTGEEFDKVWVVELNPFLTSTSPNLFSWTHDYELLHNGPFEFRIREKSSRGVLGDMTPEWKSLLSLSIPK